MKKKALVPTLNLNATKNSVMDSTASNFPNLSLGIDFTFNTIKNVKKVNWKEDAPWFREISDGLSWICYCMNPKCMAFK
jgi:hypothetical protein